MIAASPVKKRWLLVENVANGQTTIKSSLGEITRNPVIILGIICKPVRQATLESELKQREKLRVVMNAFNVIIKVGLAQLVRATDN